MADKGKGLLALMVGSPKPKGKSESSGDGGSEKADAVREFFEAGKAKDYEEAALVFERLYELCGDEPEVEDEDEDEDEDEV